MEERERERERERDSLFTRMQKKHRHDLECESVIERKKERQ